MYLNFLHYLRLTFIVLQYVFNDSDVFVPYWGVFLSVASLHEAHAERCLIPTTSANCANFPHDATIPPPLIMESPFASASPRDLVLSETVLSYSRDAALP